MSLGILWGSFLKLQKLRFTLELFVKTQPHLGRGGLKKCYCSKKSEISCLMLGVPSNKNMLQMLVLMVMNPVVQVVNKHFKQTQERQQTSTTIQNDNQINVGPHEIFFGHRIDWVRGESLNPLDQDTSLPITKVGEKKSFLAVLLVTCLGW